MEPRLKIAIQKSGRLQEDSLRLLRECGIRVDDGKDQLRAQARNFPLDLLYLRNSDIPQYIEDGVAHAGILGENTCLEKQKDIRSVIPLGFAKCRLSVAVSKTTEYPGVQWLQGKRIATSYPNSLRAFLEENRIEAEIHEISGSVEIAPNIGLADAICDLVSSGSTLFQNGLEEKEVVLRSEAHLYANKQLDPALGSILDKLIFRIQSVLEARQHRYLLMNAPVSSVERITQILPGMKSPTVMPLAVEGWCSIHTVIPEARFWDIIDELKASGAQGILITPIEKNDLMKPYILPERSDWPNLIRRPAMDTASLETVVGSILQAVKEEGDVALKRYTQQFDQAEISVLAVSEQEFLDAEQALEENLKAAIRLAKGNIERFHVRQHDVVEVIETMPGVRCWRKSMPIEKVGLYIPGGTAPLFSTVLMLGVPAALAGCNEVALCSPPRTDGSIHPAILYAARLAGIRSVFKVGGVQAIGAMAYGTESIPAVYKIFGPGNQYVTCAKQLLQRMRISIDLPAGPSEVLVCADHTANPEFVAADLLSQAEHGIDSQVVLVAFEETFVQQVLAAIERQLESLPRRDIAQAAMANSVAVVLKNRSEATDFINAYAPEHLILSVEDATAFSAGIANAGSVFLGHYTPESAGDYASGTNHTLPTNGYARTYSGVSLDSFVKKITFQEITREGLELLGPAVMCMAEAEALVGHSRAVAIRIGNTTP